MREVQTDLTYRKLHLPRLLPAIIIASLTLSDIIWVLHDHIVWPWDQAWYAEVTLDLLQASKGSMRIWLSSMVTAIGSKPPLLPWLGQFTVPLSALLGEVERALLLINVAASAITLVLVYLITLRLSRPSGALVALLFCGGASLFVGMSHQFVVEPLQTMSVAGLMHVALNAPEIEGRRLVARATAWLALSLLAKTTSLGFAIPFVIYIGVSSCVSGAARRSWRAWRPTAEAIPAAILISATAAWYMRNWESMLAHVRNATSSEIALQYGSVGTLASKLSFWSLALVHAVTPWTWLGISIAAGIGLSLAMQLFAAARLPLSKLPAETINSGLLFILVTLGTVVAGLLTYASQINEETRFLEPMLPCIAVLTGWGVSVFQRRWVALLAILPLAANALAGHLYAHGLVALPPEKSVWLKPAQVNTGSVERLDEAVRRSCGPERPLRYSVLGVELPDFNANSAAFFSAKQRLQLGYRCYYTSLGYAETNSQRAFDRLYELEADYFVTLPPKQIPNDPKDFLNQASSAVAERVAASRDWQPVTQPSSPAQVWQRLR